MGNQQSIKPLVIFHADCQDGFGAAFAAWLKLGNEALVPLGICDDFDEAFERAEIKQPCSHWVFSRQGLEEFKAEILRELP